MITTILYVLLGLGVVTLAWALVRQPITDKPRPEESRKECFSGLWETPRLRIAERIFDAADFHWLRDEIVHPELARALARARKQIALEWLKAVRLSFDHLVRTPAPVAPSPEPVPRLLWMSLRFRILLGYATLVVRLFGPYHRLIWSFDFLATFSRLRPAPSGAGLRSSGPRRDVID